MKYAILKEGVNGCCQFLHLRASSNLTFQNHSYFKTPTKFIYQTRKKVMGNKRMIDMDGLCFDDELAVLGVDGLFLYARLWSLAEDSGCFLLNAQWIQCQMGMVRSAFSINRIKEIIAKLIELHKIIPYTKGNKTYGYLKNLNKHQRKHYPSPPIIPLPDWIEWHPKQKASDPVQHYIWNDPPDDISPDPSPDISPDISPDPTRRGEERRRDKRLKRISPSEIEANLENGSLSSSKQIEYWQRFLLEPMPELFTEVMGFKPFKESKNGRAQPETEDFKHSKKFWAWLSSSYSFKGDDYIYETMKKLFKFFASGVKQGVYWNVDAPTMRHFFANKEKILARYLESQSIKKEIGHGQSKELAVKN